MNSFSSLEAQKHECKAGCFPPKTLPLPKLFQIWNYLYGDIFSFGHDHIAFVPVVPLLSTLYRCHALCPNTTVVLTYIFSTCKHLHNFVLVVTKHKGHKVWWWWWWWWTQRVIRFDDDDEHTAAGTSCCLTDRFFVLIL